MDFQLDMYLAQGAVLVVIAQDKFRRAPLDLITVLHGGVSDGTAFRSHCHGRVRIRVTHRLNRELDRIVIRVLHDHFRRFRQYPGTRLPGRAAAAFVRLIDNDLFGIIFRCRLMVFQVQRKLDLALQAGAVRLHNQLVGPVLQFGAVAQRDLTEPDLLFEQMLHVVNIQLSFRQRIADPGVVRRRLIQLPAALHVHPFVIPGILRNRPVKGFVGGRLVIAAREIRGHVNRIRLIQC